MPITQVTYKLISDMKAAGLFPARPDVLELGESNWYGDLPLGLLAGDIGKHVPDEGRREALLASLGECERKLNAVPPELDALWELSRIFYRVFLDYESYTCIDMSGSPSALKLDLNEPVTLDRRFGVVINFGTAEHVFNVWQMFKTIHIATLRHGLMIHQLPFQGWIDHGFYTFQPTFYFDLAKANEYEIIMIVCVNRSLGKLVQITSQEQVAALARNQDLKGNSSLVAIFRKSGDVPFRTPMQGYYVNSVSPEVREAWHKNR